MAGDLMVDGSADSTPAHKDRSLGLVIFGVLQILIGLGCAALVPLSLVAQSLGNVGGVASTDAVRSASEHGLPSQQPQPAPEVQEAGERAGNIGQGAGRQDTARGRQLTLLDIAAFQNG